MNDDKNPIHWFYPDLKPKLKGVTMEEQEETQEKTPY